MSTKHAETDEPSIPRPSGIAPRAEYRRLWERTGGMEALAEAKATYGFPPAVYRHVEMYPATDAVFPEPVTADMVVSLAAIAARYGHWHLTGAQRTLTRRCLRRTHRGAMQNAKRWIVWCEEHDACYNCLGKAEIFDDGESCPECHGEGTWQPDSARVAASR